MYARVCLVLPSLVTGATIYYLAKSAMFRTTIRKTWHNIPIPTQTSIFTPNRFLNIINADADIVRNDSSS